MADNRGQPGAPRDRGGREHWRDRELDLRNRALAGFAAVGAKLIEVGDHEERLRALEANLQGRVADEPDAFADVHS